MKACYLLTLPVLDYDDLDFNPVRSLSGSGRHSWPMKFEDRK